MTILKILKKSNDTEEVFNDVIGSLDIDTNGYALSNIRDTLNKKLKPHGKGLDSKFTFLSVHPDVRHSHKVR